MNVSYNKELQKVVYKYNSSKPILVLLVKSETCPACIRFKDGWNEVMSTPELQNSCSFTSLDSINDRVTIDQLSIYGKKYLGDINSCEIKYFPTILIFLKIKNGSNEYVFYENFKYNRPVLKSYLMNMQLNISS